MDVLPEISAANLKAFLHAHVDEFADKLVDCMNQAQPGRLIADTEEFTRKFIQEFGQAAYQAALQEKVEAAEAAFPPSRGNTDRPGDGATGDQTPTE